nr:DUF2310 family Zn-ribbon-containing protein [Aeromonas rivipollensis]
MLTTCFVRKLRPYRPFTEIFDFKCDPCRLVSNLSWDFKD